MELFNYPSGDPEFDKWFREQQPSWAAEIDAKIEKESSLIELVRAGNALLPLLESDSNAFESWGSEIERFLTALSKFEVG